MKSRRHQSWVARAVLSVLWLLTLVGPAGTARACTAGACVFAGPRISSVDSTRGALLNALMGGLLGSSVSLSVLDWQAIAAGDLNLDAYLQALRQRVGVSSTSEALNTQTTLLVALQAATDVAQTDGDIALVRALDALAVPVGPLSSPVTVGDLLKVSFPTGALADARLNVLDFLTGLVELYNNRNVLTTPSPVTLSGAAVGLGSVVQSVQLYLQVIEQPVYICGPAGTSFHTAAIRIKLNLDLVDTSLDTSALDSALASTLGGLAVTSSLTLTQLQAYVEVARADGTITTLDAVLQGVTLQGQPGVADVEVGTLPDALFFNRTRPVNPATDLGFGDVGRLNITVKNTLGTTLSAVSVGVQVLGSAVGSDGTLHTVTATPPYPQSLSFASSSVSALNLATSLASSLQLRLNGSLGPLLDPLVNSVILPPVRTAVVGGLAPVIRTVLTGLVDPLLELVGTRIGEAVFQVLGVAQACAGLSLDKQGRNLDSGGSFGTSLTALPGQRLEYCLSYRNPGWLTARDIVIRDLIQPGAVPLLSVPTYGGAAMTLNGVGLSAAPNDDAGEWNGQLLTVRISSLNGQASGRLCYQVRVP